MKILIQFGRAKNVHRRRIPLIEASANGHPDIVQYLLMQKNCNINATNSNKLNSIEVAVINGHFEVVEILIKNGAIQQLLDYSSLVSHDYLEVFSHLEKHGCLF